MKKVGAIILVLSMFLGFADAARVLDYAAEDAGYEVIKALSNRQLPTVKVAVLPLFGDRNNITPIIKAEMTRYPGIYEFYVRDEADWNKLVGEIEFGDRKSDIMDQTTIQKFGQIKGVEALLYGDVREATETDGQGVLRLTLKLADVKTGKVLWSSNIEGRYSGEPTAPSRATAAAVRAAAKKAAGSLASSKGTLGELNIYVLPMDVNNMRLSEYVLPEFTKVRDEKVKIFSGAAPQGGRRMVNKMASELSTSGIVASDLKRISKQLNQLFDGDASGQGNRRDAVLYGRYSNLESDKMGISSATLNLHLADLMSGEELWGETVDVITVDKVGIARKYWPWALGGLIVLFLISRFVKANSIPR